MRIAISEVSFSYEKDNRVLRDLSFEIPHNSVTGILGSSGCGKSTLLRLICGILPNAASNRFIGKITFHDSDFSVFEMRRSGRIGFMFQEPGLLPNLTVEENIRLPLDVMRRPRSRTAVDEILETVGLSSYKTFLPKHLSGGMQTRVALARTFISKPDLLLLDEPFSSLDFGWKIDLYSLLRQLMKESQATVVLVTHDINEILLLADRVILLTACGQFVNSTEILTPKPHSLSPAALNSFFEAAKNHTLAFQNSLVTERGDSLC